jgi:UDP-N-acetylmuramyl pentapeptide phosphotransferase/UDP-N-acetylglucosamine-1-phosphate transferase
VRRPNYRGRHVVFPLGVLLLAAAGLVLALEPTRWLAFLCGVGCLGLIDDLVDAQPRGWRGHGQAVLGGEVSTGALKAAGTIGLAAWAAAGDGATGLALVAEALVLALAAHLGNLLDTRPGRAEKGLALTAGALCIAAWSLAPLDPIAPLIAPVAVCSWLTLREHAMLGDTGASMIGGMTGIVLVSALAAPGTYLVLAVLLVFAIYGEFRSIGSAVERVPLFQRLDSLGRAS